MFFELQKPRFCRGFLFASNWSGDCLVLPPVIFFSRMATQNQATAARLKEIEKELAELQEKRTQLRSHWEHEKALIKSIRGQREEIEQLRIEADQLERQGDLAKVAEIRYGRIPNIE